MIAHARLKNDFAEDEKCHNLTSWLSSSYILQHHGTQWLQYREAFSQLITTECIKSTLVQGRGVKVPSTSSPFVYAEVLWTIWMILEIELLWLADNKRYGGVCFQSFKLLLRVEKISKYDILFPSAILYKF